MRASPAHDFTAMVKQYENMISFPCLQCEKYELVCKHVLNIRRSLARVAKW